MRAVFLDGMGTLLDLAPPWDALVQRLRDTHEIDLDRATAERAFRAEILYYQAHHTEGRDTKSLADLRLRCAHVLLQELPPPVQAAVGTAELRDLMLDCLRFTVFADARQAPTDHTSSARPMSNAIKHIAKTEWLSDAPKYCQIGALAPG